MSTNSTIHVTENWKVNYNARFDLINQDLVSHTFSIYRDLHCWELKSELDTQRLCLGSLS